MREVFRAGTVNQFLLHGNVRDLVRNPDGNYVSLRDFLTEVLFARFDLVVYFNGGSGLRALKGQDHLNAFLKILKDFTGYSAAGLPREAGQALDLLDGLLRYSLQRTTVVEGKVTRSPLKTVVILDFVQFLVPANPNDRASQTLIRLLDWSCNVAHLQAQLATVLIADSLKALARDLVENPYSAKIDLPMPGRDDCRRYLDFLVQKHSELVEQSELSLEALAGRSVGLTLVNLGHMVALALKNRRRITSEYLSRTRKELIEKECYGLLEFVESKRSLDDVAGHRAAREWLREDARLLKEGHLDCVPMGYLIAGRIGTGKTWLTHCWAGEVGVPFVIFKNFRDKWAGATESNLEKIFEVLRALGQVVVFVDEADQMAGKRSGQSTDGGLSGRVYGMLAQAMSDTGNRGRILWVFATSRPDLLEVDLKRPGRLDVHIPLFPPQNDDERKELFAAMARKVGLEAEQLPELPAGVQLSGNEMESLMVRARRRQALDRQPLAEVLAALLAEFRPMAHQSHLEYMDMVAVKECTDERFLPPAYRELSSEEINGRLDRLALELGF